MRVRYKSDDKWKKFPRQYISDRRVFSTRRLVISSVPQGISSRLAPRHPEGPCRSALPAALLPKAAAGCCVPWCDAEAIPCRLRWFKAVTQDIRPRAVLETLLGHGIVTARDDDRICFDAAFISRPGGEEQMFHFNRNICDRVVAAVWANGADGATPCLDRSGHCEGLTLAQVRLPEATA
jgi:hypothetical protein